MDIEIIFLGVLLITLGHTDACQDDVDAMDICRESRQEFQKSVFLTTRRSALDVRRCGCRIRVENAKLMATIVNLQRRGCSSELILNSTNSGVSSTCENRNIGEAVQGVQSISINVRKKREYMDEYCVEVRTTGKGFIVCQISRTQRTTNVVSSTNTEITTTSGKTLFPSNGVPNTTVGSTTIRTKHTASAPTTEFSTHYSYKTTSENTSTDREITETTPRSENTTLTQTEYTTETSPTSRETIRSSDTSLSRSTHLMTEEALSSTTERSITLEQTSDSNPTSTTSTEQISTSNMTTFTKTDRTSTTLEQTSGSNPTSTTSAPFKISTGQISTSYMTTFTTTGRTSTTLEQTSGSKPTSTTSAPLSTEQISTKNKTAFTTTDGTSQTSTTNSNSTSALTTKDVVSSPPSISPTTKHTTATTITSTDTITTTDINRTVITTDYTDNRSESATGTETGYSNETSPALIENITSTHTASPQTTHSATEGKLDHSSTLTTNPTSRSTTVLSTVMRTKTASTTKSTIQGDTTEQTSLTTLADPSSRNNTPFTTSEETFLTATTSVPTTSNLQLPLTTEDGAASSSPESPTTIRTDAAIVTSTKATTSRDINQTRSPTDYTGDRSTTASLSNLTFTTTELTTARDDNQTFHMNNYTEHPPDFTTAETTVSTQDFIETTGVKTTEQTTPLVPSGYRKCLQHSRALDVCGTSTIVEKDVVLHTNLAALEEVYCSCDVMSSANMSVTVHNKGDSTNCTSSIIFQRQEGTSNVFCKQTTFDISKGSNGIINTISLQMHKEILTRADYCIELSSKVDLPITVSCGQRTDTIEPRPNGSCLEIAVGYGTLNDYVGFLKETKLGDTRNSSQKCPVDDSPLITGRCDGDTDSGTYWVVHMSKECDFTEMKNSRKTAELAKLSQAVINRTTIHKLLNELVLLTDDYFSLTPKDIIYVADILSRAIKITPVPKTVTQLILSIVSNVMFVEDDVLLEAQQVGAATERIIKVVDVIGSVTDIAVGEKWRTVHQNIALQIWSMTKNSTRAFGFGLTSNGDVVPLNMNTIQDTLLYTIKAGHGRQSRTTEAQIMLPESFIHRKMNSNTNTVLKISMHIYNNGKLFKDSQSTSKNAATNRTVYRHNSKVVACSVLDGYAPIKSLGGDFITTVLLPIEKRQNPVCGYWQHRIEDSSSGFWNTDGCLYNGTVNGRHVCSCDHLTNFAVLMDFNRNDELSEKDRIVLNFITMIGLAVSIFALLITVISFILFRKLRAGRSQKTLFQLSLALISTWMIFIIGIDQTGHETGCLIVAAMLHYFLLVAFMWMCVEAVVQYYRFVKVLGTYIPHFILKAAILAWGLPLIPIIAISAIDFNLYKSGTDFCWMSQEAFYYAFAPPVGVMVAFNFILYYIVVSNICWRRTDGTSMRNSTNQHLLNIRAAISVFVLLGLTWIFGFLTVTDGKVIFSYVFTILSVLQGLQIFILFSLRDNQFRMEWMRVCCHKRYIRRQRLSLTSSITFKRNSQRTSLQMIGYNNGGFRKERVPSK